MALKTGPAPGRAQSPHFPDRVREIVRLRDEGLAFAEISRRVGGTRMNCCALYNRWRDWARAQGRVAAE